MAEIRLGVFGAQGRLGARVVALAREVSGITLALAMETEKSNTLGQAVPLWAGTVYWADTTPLHDVDVVVDVSSPAAAAAHAHHCAQHRVPLLMATTGLTPADHAALANASAHIPVCVAPNLSTGVWVLAHLVAQAAAALGEFDVEVVETHHQHKKDAPSGTALLLAQHVARARTHDLDGALVKDRGGHPGVRGAGSVGMATLRGGDVVGDHTVYFFGEGERLELTHRAHSRDVFARGALRLVTRLAGCSAGMVTVPELLGLRGV